MTGEQWENTIGLALVVILLLGINWLWTRGGDE